jgi:hypothetical protein
MPFLRNPVLLIVAAAAAMIAFLAWLGGGSVQQGVFWFGIPPMKPVFADLRLLLSGVDCAATGHDVLAANPCDPWKRPFNYPRVWLAVLGAIGLGQRAAPGFGLLLAAVFAACALYILRACPASGRWAAVLAAISPAAMFMVERGNNDIVIFALLTLAVALRGRLGAAGPLAATPGLILIAAAAKLFPAVAFAMLARGWNRRQLIAGGVGLLATLALFWATADDIAKIAKGTATSPNLSFGRDIAVHFADRQLLLKLGTAQTAVSIALAIVALAIALLIWRRLRGRGADAVQTGGEAQDFFLVGALVFCGAFLAGRNWDYRLCFLLMCLPQALAWAEAAATRTMGRWLAWSIVAALWIGELVPTVWTWSGRALVFPTLDEAANWIVFTLCLAGIALLLWPAKKESGR